MNPAVGSAQIGQWYRRADKGELFQVIACDDQTHTIEIQNFDGDIDEIDEATWSTLPVALAEPPEDWTGPVDDVEFDDLGYSETDMRASDWEESLAPNRAPPEAWQDEGQGEGEGGSQGEESPPRQTPP